jgi:hypothetical protein
VAPPTKLSTWILAGQSNMEGYGLLADIDPAEVPDPRIRLFSSAGRWESAAHPLHRLGESFTPVHIDLYRQGVSYSGPSLEGLADHEVGPFVAAQERPHGAGLGLAFARAVADATGRPVGLIATAHGGASLDQWSPDLRAEGGRSLYGSMLERVRVARETADVELAGILWYQGESDSGELRIAESYAERFDRWVAEARADLEVADLPVLVVQLARVVVGADGVAFPGWDTVREAQRTLARRTTRTGCVAALDLPLSDPVHLSALALERLGRRLAHLAISGSAPNPVTAEWGEAATNGLPTVRLRCSGVTGGWRAGPDSIPGFVLCDALGEPHPTLGVVDAGVAPDDPTAILVRLSGGDPDARLAYGLGLDRTCTLVDGADLALPAFSPMPIGSRGSVA